MNQKIEEALSVEKSALKNLLRKTVKTDGEFTLSSGEKSNIFVNCKQVSLTPMGQKLVGVLFNSLLSEDEIKMLDGVAGVPIGGFPLADGFARTWEGDFSILYVRKTEKNHGMRSLVEGNVSPGMNVILLEDVITTGKSVLEAMESLDKVGCKVSRIMALIDRESGGPLWLKTLTGVPVTCLFTLSEILADN